MGACHMLPTESSSILKFGRFEGIWKGADTDAEFEIVIDENNFHPFNTNKYGKYAFEGFFEWRIIAGKDYEDAWGRQAMEKLRGFYFNYDTKDKDQYHFICLGYELVEKGEKRFLGHDGYDICLNPNEDVIQTMTLGHALKWNNPLTLNRTASKSQLVTLLYNNQYLKEQGIVSIITDYLHYFEKPNKVIYNAWSFNKKLKAMDKRRIKRIRPLFEDIPYIEHTDNRADNIRTSSF